MKFDTNPNVDSQRQAEYNWEWRLQKAFPELGGGERMTLDQCRELVQMVWADFTDRSDPTSAPCPRVVSRKEGSCPCYQFSHVIKLPRNGRNGMTVLHEVAHALQSRYCRDLWPSAPDYDGLLNTYRNPAHGRGFASLMLLLLYRYFGLNVAAMRKLRQPNVNPFTGKKIGRAVHFAPMDMIPKPLGRVRVAARRLAQTQGGAR